jgi:hypothetical protein
LEPATISRLPRATTTHQQPTPRHHGPPQQQLQRILINTTTRAPLYVGKEEVEVGEGGDEGEAGGPLLASAISAHQFRTRPVHPTCKVLLRLMAKRTTWTGSWTALTIPSLTNKPFKYLKSRCKICCQVLNDGKCPIRQKPGKVSIFPHATRVVVI